MNSYLIFLRIIAISLLCISIHQSRISPFFNLNCFTMNTGTVVFNDALPLETICNDVVTPIIMCGYTHLPIYQIVYYIPHSRLWKLYRI